MRTRTKGQGNKRMKRFRETGSMLKDPSKGSSLRRDLGKGAADIKTAFKKIKDAGKSLTRGTKDLTATRVSAEGPKQGPSPKPKVTAQQAGDKLINASKKLASDSRINRGVQTKGAKAPARSSANTKEQKILAKINKVKGELANLGKGFSTAPLKSKVAELEKQLEKERAKKSEAPKEKPTYQSRGRGRGRR